jgi:hypothetical protein
LDREIVYIFSCLARDLLKLSQLATRLSEMASEPLQILLHKLRGLRKKHRTQHTEQTINQGLACGEKWLKPAHDKMLNARRRPTQAYKTYRTTP